MIIAPRKTTAVVQVHKCTQILRICFPVLWLSVHLFQSVQILPVNAHDSGCVLRPLHSSFNLQRCNPCPDNLRKQFKRTQILHTQKVFLVAKYVSLPVFPSERKPTWLRTASPVAAPASDHAAEKTLSGIAIAKRTMYKGLDLDPGLLYDLLHLVQRQLPRRDDSCDAVPLQYTHTVTAGNRHLRARMHRKPWKMLCQILHHAKILHNHSIQPCLIIRKQVGIQLLFQLFLL